MLRSTALRSYARLETRKPLRRKKWMRRRPPRRIARQTEREAIHKAAIREAGVCAVARYLGAGRCTRVFHVAHLGAARGVGLKHGDWTETALLCSRHHRAVDQRLWPFSEMTDEEFAAWKAEEIHRAREFVAGRQAVSR